MSNRISAQEIKELAAECGYTRCGITTAAPFQRFRTALDHRVQRFPQTASLYEGMRPRVDPRRKAPWVSSIVVGVRSYADFAIPDQLDRFYGRNYLFDSRLEACPDSAISECMARGLKDRGIRFRKGGVPDRLAAARAGAARIGYNGFAFTPESGSWINIETWRVDAELSPDEPTWQPPCPPECTACVQACPTGALEAPYIMRMDRCVAHLTYAAAEPVDEELWQNMGCWMYGCDDCQLACPLNQHVWRPLRSAPWLEQAADFLHPESILRMQPAELRERVLPLFWYIPPQNLSRWCRNARRAAHALARR